MKTFIFLWALMLTQQLKSQIFSSINPTNPINSIKYYYTNLGDLELSITLSEIKLDSTSHSHYIPPDAIKFENLKATVEWESSVPNNQIIVPLHTESDNKFRYTTIFAVHDKNANNTYPIKKRKKTDLISNKYKWNAVKNISISYTLNGIAYKLPLFDILPEIPEVGGIKYSVSVIEPGLMQDKSKASIILKTEPLPASGNLVSVNLVSPSGASFPIIPDLESKNGLFKLDINNSTITFVEGQWGISAEVDIEEPGISNAKTIPDAKFFLKYEPVVNVLNISDNFTVDTKGKDNIEITVQTKGRGTIDLQFVPDIKSIYNVSVTSTHDENQLYTFKINNLRNIPKGKTIYFNIIDQNNRILTNGLHPFTNTSPTLDNFSIDVSGGTSKVKFDLPNYVDINSISVLLANLGISASGEQNIKVFSTNTTEETITYSAGFGGIGFSELQDNLKRDSVIESDLVVKVNDESLYEIKLKFISQQYVNTKLKELIAITLQKTKKADLDIKKDKLKTTLTDIINVIGKVDEVVSSEEVQNTVETLADGDNKEKASDVMQTIAKVGTWVGSLGPIVIPLLL